MPLAAGTRIGGYEILALLGAGGMGEVYRARDTRLGRDVAVKIVAPVIAADADGLMRFEREARLLASLNHPNIAAIYGVEDTAGQPALVLELVDGETLADRIARGPIPIAQALAYARQIADALDTAHEAGIVHRDLKPANIKIAEGGTIKVLDFGLAKAIAAAATPATTVDPSQSPTVTVHGTRHGVILGTVAYMSPEQARGKPVDKRTDIWAFGCVLFEMLTGRSTFSGETTSDVIAAIIERSPDWSKLPASTPAHVRRVIERCLEKDPKRRARDIADVAVQLGGDPGVALMPQSGRWMSAAIAAAVVAAVAAIAGALIARSWTPASEERPLVRSTIGLPADYRLAVRGTDYPLAISRDGARVAFVGEKDGVHRVFVRALADDAARELPGTERAMHPFFSPDGDWVGYFASGTVQKVAFAGGSPIRLGAVVGGEMLGSTWGAGVIVFAQRGLGLSRINDAGGKAEPIPGTDTAAWPFMLGNGRTILFVTGRPTRAVAAMDVDGSNRRIVASTSQHGAGPEVLGAGGDLAQVQLSGGYLVFGQSPNMVRALPVDPNTLTPTGGVVPLLSGVERARNGGAIYYAASQNGTLIYSRSGDAHLLVWVDRRGVETPITSERQAYRLPTLSPDGHRVVIAINDETRRSQLWLYDTDGRKMRLTTEGHNLRPVWSPDGTRVAFSGFGVESVEIRGLRRERQFAREALPDSWPVGTNPYPTSWSRDGKTMLLQADSTDVWAMSLSDRQVRPILSGASDDAEGMFSPDGQWIAYQSDESGRSEVCIRRFPSLDDVTVISANGGVYPQWSGDGKELFYKEGDTMIAARLELEPRPRVIARERLFTGYYLGTGREGAFDVTADGQRFVMVKSDPASALQELTLMQNWMRSLDRPRE